MEIPTDILAEKLGGIMVFIVLLLGMVLFFCDRVFRNKDK